ncbi:MAG: hypothetical protein GF411_06115 [Candidatus Lokiarchaeota archaeon]|nr:hypothetical protein [Candidatus Lokiarchaeota archaeon]
MNRSIVEDNLVMLHTLCKEKYITSGFTWNDVDGYMFHREAKHYVVIIEEHGIELNRSDFFDSYSEAERYAKAVRSDWSDPSICVHIQEGNE